MRFSLVRFQRQRLSKGGYRSVMISELLKRAAQTAVRFIKGWIKLNGLAKERYCQMHFAFARQRHSHDVMRFGEARLELDRGSEFGNGAVDLLFVEQRDGAAEMLFSGDRRRALRLRQQGQM